MDGLSSPKGDGERSSIKATVPRLGLLVVRRSGLNPPLRMEPMDKLVAREIAAIGDASVRAALERRLVPPRCVMRNWDYADDVQHACWIIAEDPLRNTSIAYCDHGFGPASAWGLLNTESKHSEMGPDSVWYSRLEDAFRQSLMWDGENPDDYEVQ